MSRVHVRRQSLQVLRQLLEYVGFQEHIERLQYWYDHIV